MNQEQFERIRSLRMPGHPHKEVSGDVLFIERGTSDFCVPRDIDFPAPQVLLVLPLPPEWGRELSLDHPFTSCRKGWSLERQLSDIVSTAVAPLPGTVELCDHIRQGWNRGFYGHGNRSKLCDWAVKEAGHYAPGSLRQGVWLTPLTWCRLEHYAEIVGVKPWRCALGIIGSRAHWWSHEREAKAKKEARNAMKNSATIPPAFAAFERGLKSDTVGNADDAEEPEAAPRKRKTSKRLHELV